MTGLSYQPSTINHQQLTINHEQMLIEPFTIVAQIINFLILVALLKRFLYGPIVKAMSGREAKIADYLQEAAAKEEIAQEEATKYRQKQQELEAKWQEYLNRIKQEVEAERQVLMKETRAEIDAVRKEWYQGLEREKETFLGEFRQRASQQLTRTIRQALNDLANVSLEQHIVETFIEHLQQLDDSQLRKILASPVRHLDRDLERDLVIRSTFAIPREVRYQLIDAIHEHIEPEVKVKFETAPSSICGIELRDRGYKISWNLEHYLESLEGEIEKALTNGATPK